MTSLITGGSSGIGAAVAAALAAQGQKVVLIGRDPARTDAAAELIRRRTPGADIDVVIADLALLSEVRGVAGEMTARYPGLDLVVLNAAVSRPVRELTAEGFEVDLATNHLSPFLLAQLLSRHLSTHAPAQIINVSSSVHSRVKTLDLDSLATGFTQSGTYATTKLLNLIAMTELRRRLDGTGVSVTSVDPGFVRTALGRDATGALGVLLKLTRPFQTSPSRAAAPIARLATGPAPEAPYYTAKGPATPSPLATDPTLAAKVWTWTERLITP